MRRPRIPGTAHTFIIHSLAPQASLHLHALLRTYKTLFPALFLLLSRIRIIFLMKLLTQQLTEAFQWLMPTCKP